MAKAISSTTSLLGLFGRPVKHSLSPFIHNYIFQKSNLDAVYLCFDISYGRVETAVESIKALEMIGVNVTIPYKEKVIKCLDKIDKTASKIGAVNTIKNVNGRLIGYNTDIKGFMLSLEKKASFSAKSKKAVVLGAGGAAKAVCCGLAEQKAGYIGIYDIDIGHLDIAFPLSFRFGTWIGGIIDIFEALFGIIFDNSSHFNSRTNGCIGGVL